MNIGPGPITPAVRAHAPRLPSLVWSLTLPVWLALVIAALWYAPAAAYLWTVPLFHCNGWCFPWAVTAAGGRHVCLQRVDPEKIVELAVEGGCNAVASTLGVLGAVARRYAHRIPFLVKLNHNELLSYPNTYDQVYFGQVEQAFDMGAVAIGATIYFGAPESRRQIQETSAAFQLAHELGLATVLWCYTRNNAFKIDGVDYHESADLTGQANHLGVTIQADIIKQKLPETNGGFTALKFG